MHLTFGNMMLELNINHLSKKHMPLVEEDHEKICQIDAIMGEQYQLQQLQEELIEEPREVADEL